MLKITQSFIKLFALFALSLFVLFIGTYFSLKEIIIELESLEIYNEVWMILGIAFLSILLLIYFSIKNIHHKLSQDITELQNYLDEVSNKNYKAVVKIKYFHEFLEMSLRLKNIVKRLNNKDAKKK